MTLMLPGPEEERPRPIRRVELQRLCKDCDEFWTTEIFINGILRPGMRLHFCYKRQKPPEHFNCRSTSDFDFSKFEESVVAQMMRNFGMKL